MIAQLKTAKPGRSMFERRCLTYGGVVLLMELLVCCLCSCTAPADASDTAVLLIHDIEMTSV